MEIYAVIDVVSCLEEILLSVFVRFFKNDIYLTLKNLILCMHLHKLKNVSFLLLESDSSPNREAFFSFVRQY